MAEQEGELVQTVCPYCGCGCAMNLEVKGGKVVKVYGIKGHPVSDGFLCLKGRTCWEWVHDRERLTMPLMRSGEKFKQVSWDKAIDHTVTELRRIRDVYGPNSIGFLSSARCTNEENYLFMKFASAVIGTNNVDSCARLCHSTTAAALAQNLGSGVMTNSLNDIDKAGCIMIFGSNTLSQHPLVGIRMLKAQKNGTKIVVVDPRRTEIAKKADIHLQLIPGTDTPLINAMMRVILKEGFEDLEFVRARTKGFDYLTKILRRFTTEYAAEITGLPKELIREAAMAYGSAERGSIYYTMGITQHVSGVENIVNLSNLAMLTGNFGKEGTGVNPLRGQNNVQGSGDMGALPDCHPGYRIIDEQNTSQLCKLWDIKSLPFKAGITSVEMIESVPEKIRAMVIMGENPALAHPALDETRRSLQQLEFMVCLDIFPTDTTKFANVVLPAACWAEKDGTFTNTERRVQRIRKAVEPPGEAKPDWWIITELARAMGKQRVFPYQNPEEIFNEIRSAVPQYGAMNYQRIGSEGIQWPCNKTYPDGKKFLYEDRFFTSDGMGKFFPIEYTPPREKADEFHNFIMLTGRINHHYHTMTQTGRCPTLMKLAPECLMEVNPEDAGMLMLEDGDIVKVSSRMGEVEVKIKVTDDTMPGHVFMPFHYPEAPVNMLTIPNLDPIGKTPGLKITPVKIDPLVSQFDDLHPEGVITQKDNILAVIIYNCMLRFGWIGEKIVIGDDVHNMSFMKTDMPGASLKIDLERIECFLDVKARIEGMGSARKRLDLDEFVSDNLETMNMRVLMKRIHNILTQVTAKPEEEKGEEEDSES